MSTVTRSASASPMALNGVIDASLFPLKSTADVVNLFRRALTSGIEPDLTLLSIVVGYIELSLTTGEAAAQAAQAAAAAAAAGDISQAATGNDIIMGNSVPFPVVTHELIAGLYKKFQTILSVVEKPKPHRQATREVIKKVSDVIWNSLIRSSYKDRAHLQNLYSYLSGNKLDCFGVALAVVAGCQLLGYKDVRLVISEDHAWVVFGQKRVETIEVTWHGKGSEDKRGQDIRPGIESGSWLYLGGLAVVCERGMEVAAICAALNISLTSNSDCVEVAELQQQLLWLLYDLGHLKRYPMALGTLGELEEIHRTHPSIGCEQLYREAIESARTYYRNHHVYPYTYQGNYYNRLLKYRDAFAAWANAADVIRLYTYQCRDDEEIYKELLDIANELIPYVMKTESSGHSARSILRDAEVFANLLRFYDGICQWEEDSLTPILHIGWAKPLVNNITKFDYDIRSQVVIKLPEDLEAEQARAELARAEQEAKEAKESKEATGSEALEGNNNTLVKKEEKTKHSEMPTTLADLTAACGEKILNPDFLLQGGGQPFADQKQQAPGGAGESDITALHNNNNNSNSNNNNNHSLDKKEAPSTTTTAASNGSGTSVQLPVVSSEANSAAQAQAQSQNQASSQQGKPQHKEAKKEETSDDYDPFEIMLKRPVITLYSQKMKGLKDLLLAEKLNTHAISLQVTAQSVASRKVRGVEKQQSATISATITAISSSSADSVLSAVGGGGGGSGSGGIGGASLASSSPGGDSIAASRPKRTRRE
ncbi:menin [Drosophila takahashii]|uniref:menin n=1 Tax=Drosophila takahashii TaxID=29030 RepID=UPI001CF90C5C|nr:menin [Drosophila takahashii]